MPDASNLTPEQRVLLQQWFADLEVVADWSWGLTDTVVLHARSGGRDLVVKAAGPQNHHIAREIRAHREWVGPLADRGLAPRLLHAEESANLLVTAHLEGELALGTAAEGEAATYAQAGGLLALLHGQASRTDPDFEREQNARTLRWLEGPHRIDADTAAEIRARVATFDCPPALLVPTHGDWQPRNWLAHGGCIRAIDFGRADWRPAFSDLARLAVQQFADRPDLEAAFLAGYGTDPRDPDAWRRNQLREAVGTACWAYQVGDTSFETQGHRMIADALRVG